MSRRLRAERVDRTERTEHVDRTGRGHATVGVVLLAALSVALVAGVGASLFAAAAPPEPPPAASLSLAADGDALTFVHRGGDSLDVRELDVRVTVDGTELARQPPVPFFSARGFRPGPTGPFNVASDPTWRAGEAATLRVAGTNEPQLRPGAYVEVTLSIRGYVVAELEATV